MIQIISHKKWYFILSLVVIIPGLISLLLFGLKTSIDFSGGSRITLLDNQNVSATDQLHVRKVFASNKVDIATVQTSARTMIIRTKPLDQKVHTKIINDIAVATKNNIKEESYETVGPTIGAETTVNAIEGVSLAALLIVLYIAWSFRGVPKPTSSWRFGICAIIALLHDVLVLIGIFSLLGHFFGVEIDSLFVTALLTVIGFSVHDTIVVFDRIRENLKNNFVYPFPDVVNNSMLQTMGRSVNTSLTVVLVLLALLFFGGESIRWFVVALLIGVISGTYSSIFNASPLLVVWNEWSMKRKK